MPTEAPSKPDIKKSDATPIAEPGAKAAQKFSEQFSGKVKEKPVAAAKVEETPEVKAKREEAEKTAAATKAAAKKKPAAVAPVAPQPDYEKITEAVTKGVRAATPEPKKEVVVEDELPADEKENIEVLERMEKDYPELYKDRAAAYAKSLKAAKKYRADWEAANPGKEFEATDAEHNDFFDKNDVEWDDKHFTRSLARVEADKAAGKVTVKTTEKLNEVEHEQKRRERATAEEPKAVAHQATMAKDYFGQFANTDAAYVEKWKTANLDKEFNPADPEHNEFGKILDADGNINTEEVKRITEADPVKAIVLQAAQTVEVFTGEMYRLINGLADVDVKDKAKGKLHQDIIAFVEENEKAMSELPPEQSMKGEKKFISAEGYAKLKKDERDGYWRYTINELSELYARTMALNVKNHIAAEEEKLNKFATARGLKKPETANGVLPKHEEKVVEATNGEHKHKSPSGAIPPRIAPIPTPAGGGAGNAVSSFTKQWRG